MFRIIVPALVFCLAAGNAEQQYDIGFLREQFWQFAIASRIELRKVVWPEREETIKTTYVVFIFAIVMGLFFWGLDWVLTWLTRVLTGQSA